MNVGRYLRGKLKQALKSQAVTSSISWLLAKYLVLVYKTSTWEHIGFEHLEQYLDNDIPFLATFWHNRLAMMAYSWNKDKPVYIMTSIHRDGRLISKVVAHHGITPIFGSSSRGGANAMRETINKLKSGHCVGITPDGPRGPRYTVQQGAVHIARMAKVDILTGAYSITNRIVFNSWDKLIFPLPFSKGVYIYNKPLKFDEFNDKKSVEEACKKLQTLMIETAAQADQYCGHEPMTVGEKRNKHR